MILRGDRRLSSVIERTLFINKSSQPNISHRIKQGSLFALSASILLACQVELGPVSEIAADASLASGIIVDGPVVNARVSVIDALGNTVATTVSGDDASYGVSIPQGTMYPVTITAAGGRDVVTQTEPLFPMVSVKLAPDASVSNITPFSTLVVKMAKAMPGGVNEATLAEASNTVFAQFGFGLDPDLVSSPVSSEVSGANVAAILKASEALTETIRRARDGLLIAGSYIDAEAILNVMAADMATDGVLDGLGTDVDPRIAATVTVASAPVLIEALSNNLTINGVNVTSSMDAGIAITEVPAAGTTADVVIPESMLVQARTAVSAAQTLSNSDEISAITTVLDGLNGGSMASDIQNVLPPEKAAAFADILVQVVLATGTELENINQVVRKADVADSGNTQTDTGSTGTGSTDGSSNGGDSTTGSSTDGGSSGGTPADGGTSGTGTGDTGSSGDGATGGGPIVDTQAPMITLVGSSLITLATGQAYVEVGASAIDNVDGVISSNIVISGQVNTGVPGSYVVSYSVSDSSGNTGTAARTVVVAPTVPGVFELDASTYSVSEGGGKLGMRILRVGGSDGAASVNWRTLTFDGYGTADWAADYGTVNWTTVNFANGETSKVISVNITQDTVDEPDETFSVLLGSPTGGATLGARSTGVVTIMDDDATATTTSSPAVQTAKYYVSISNGNDANPGTIDRPFKTVAKASSVVKPGELVYIRGGVYPIRNNFIVSGTSTAPIVYAGYPGEKVIFDGMGTTATSDHISVGANWNVFRNFEVRNSPDRGIWIANANDNVLEDIVTHNNGMSGLQIYNGNRNTIVRITSYGNYDVGTGGGNSDGIAVSSGAGNVFRDCLVYENGDDGLDLWRSLNSTIDGCVSHNNGKGGDGNGFKLGGGGTATDMTQGGHTIMRSIAYNNPANGFDWNAGYRPINVYNNTAWNNRSNNFLFGGGAHVLRNNISYQGTVKTGAAAVQSTNSWNLGVSDPRFISLDPMSSNFMKPATNSPVIDAGTYVGLPYAGAAPDLGAVAD